MFSHAIMCIVSMLRQRSLNEGSHVLFLADLQGTSSLANIHHPTIQAGDPVYNALLLVEGDQISDWISDLSASKRSSLPDQRKGVVYIIYTS